MLKRGGVWRRDASAAAAMRRAYGRHQTASRQAVTLFAFPVSSFFSPFYYILLILLSNVKDRCFVKYELRRRRMGTLIVNERNFLLLSLFKKKLTAVPHPDRPT